MGFGGGFAKSVNSNQNMILKQMMMNGQQGGGMMPGMAQEPNNPYPAGGGEVSYDPQKMEEAMDMALGKQSTAQAIGEGGGEGIGSSGMTAQGGTQLPPNNILAGLRAAMMRQGGGF